MGRATYDSIGRPLPGPDHDRADPRPGLVGRGGAGRADRSTRRLDWRPGIDEEVFVVGGATVYAEALERADAQVLTEVHLSPEGDTHYPSFERAQWHETRREIHLDAEIPHEFVWLERVGP